MSMAIPVPASERGVLRLFALDMAPEQARFLREPGAAAQVLGVGELDPENVDIFAINDLEDLGLEGYLSEGCGISADQIAPDRERLRGLTGWVMVVRSRAFGGRAVRLTPADSVALTATYNEPATDWSDDRSAGPFDVESAKPNSGPGRGLRRAPRADRNRARRIGAVVFAVIMAVVTGAVLMVVMT